MVGHIKKVTKNEAEFINDSVLEKYQDLISAEFDKEDGEVEIFISMETPKHAIKDFIHMLNSNGFVHLNETGFTENDIYSYNGLYRLNIRFFVE